MVLRFISLYIFLSILKHSFSLLSNNSSIDNKTTFDETIQSRIKLFLPEYQNKHIRINELNNTNFNFSKIRNNRNTVLVSDEILETYDEVYRREKILELINNQFITNLKGKYNTKIYSDKYKFYGTSNSFLYDHNYVWHKYIIRDTIIYEKTTSMINEIINTEPQQIIVSAQICSMQKLIFHIYNPDPELNLLIKDIRSDIYQLQIFPYSSSDSNNKIKYKDLSRTIAPKETYTLDIYIIIDFKKITLGTLYIEFNNKKVLLIPIKLNGLESQYGVSPIYHIEAQIKKMITIPIKISNPSDTVLAIKKVNYPLKKINVIWPNGSSVDSNINLPLSSLFQIQPKSNKNIIYLKYYSASPSSEYGLIQVEVTGNVIVIPVLISSIFSPIVTYPKILNFGLCQITSKSRYNIRKLIPLNLSNMGTENIKIGKVYLEYDNIFIQFHQNFNGNNLIIAPNEEIKFGFVIFDANLVSDFDKIKKKLSGKIQKGSLYIETNSTDSPFIQVNYTFLPDMGKIEKIISGDIQKLPKQKNKFSFEVKIKYNAPYGLEKISQYKLGENMTLLYEKFVETKVINPKNDDQAYNVNIIFEIEKLDIFHFKRFFYIPLFLTYSLYSYIPVQLDNNDINIIYCGNEDNSISLAYCLRNFGNLNMFDNLKNESHKVQSFKFSLGSTLFGVRRKRFIFLINENSSPIKINEIITQNNYITLRYENTEFLSNEDPIKLDTSDLINLESNLRKNIKISNKAKKIPTSIILHPYSAIKFSINLNLIPTENCLIEGKNTFIYNDNSKFVIENVAHLSNNTFDILQDSIKFEPAFPTLIQSITIDCQNNLVFPVMIFSVKSSDDRIIPTSVTDGILPEDKTSLLKIVFDPGHDSLLKKYLNGINYNKILTYKELYLWKEREKYWNKLRISGKTEINANITVNTSMGKRIIKVNSDLIKPNLLKSTGITFGLVQVGKIISGYFEIFNPSDQVLAVKLVLVPNDFSDINNNNMFSKKEKDLLLKSEDLILLGCNFIGKIDNDNSIIKEFEYIIIQENINLFEQTKDLMNKKEILKLIYKYGNPKVKTYLNRGYEVFCKYKKRNKNELIINYSKLEVVSSLFSEQFESEIEIVKNLTTKDINIESKNKEIKKQSFLEKIYSFFLNLYIKYYLHVSINTEIKKPEGEQNFFLPDQVYNQIFWIPPHKKGKLGPISFKPNRSGNISEIIILKNNLTFLHPLRLLGVGGGAEPSFFPNYIKNPLANSHIFNKTNYIIEIDEQTFNSELNIKGKITKTITLKNIGNLEMNVKNITIDGYKCETNDLKVLQCEEFTLAPNENLDIDIEIKPNLNNYITNKNIYFNTDYQVFNLNVIIIIAKDIYIKNNIIKNNIIPIIFVLIIFIILFFIGKGLFKLIQHYKNKSKVNENSIKDDDEIAFKPNSTDLEDKDRDKDKTNETKDIKENEKVNQRDEEENNNKNISKSKKKKSRKKNKTKTNEVAQTQVENNKEKEEIKDNIEKEEKESQKEETVKEEIKKEPEKKEDNFKEFKLFSPITQKQSKRKSSIKQKESEEKDKTNKNIEEKSNETDSLNEVKISNPNKYDYYDKNRKTSKNYNNYNYNQKGSDRYYQKYPNQRKSYYNTYNTFNTYNNYNNYNNYNSYIPDEKKQGNTIKLKKVNNLSDLFKSEPKKDKKQKKKIENNDKQMNPTFLKDEKINKEINLEQESLKNTDSKNISNNEIDTSIQFFNFDFDGFLKSDFNDENKINNNDESVSLEDIKEGDEIHHYVNKSLMENIDNPDMDEENVDKSRFFAFDFFNEKKDDN